MTASNYTSMERLAFLLLISVSIPGMIIFYFGLNTMLDPVPSTQQLIASSRPDSIGAFYEVVAEDSGEIRKPKGSDIFRSSVSDLEVLTEETNAISPGPLEGKATLDNELGYVDLFYLSMLECMHFM